MKIIEAMKQIKDLQRKCEDLRGKIRQCSADLDSETPLYENQKDMVAGWLQSHSDITKEILRLRLAIQRTNLATEVPIELEGKAVTKTIAEWIHRRRDLSQLELQAYMSLTDRNLKEGQVTQSTGEKRDVKIRRYYNPEARDKKLDALKSEPLLVDARLEVVNAVTDLME